MATSSPSILISYLFAIFSFSCWGFSAIYFKYMDMVPLGEVIAYRVVWVLILCGGGVVILRQTHKVKRVFNHKRNFFLTALSAFILASNWFVYAYSSQNAEMLQVSLGYFVSPLISVFLGYMVFKNRLNRYQKIAIIIVLSAIFIELFTLGKIPFIGLYLAVSFALYGLIKKKVILEPLVCGFIESLVLSPFAFFYIGHLYYTGSAASLHYGFSMDLLLMLSGLLMLGSMVSFIKATQYLELSTMGFLQYLAPIMIFIIGLFYGESLSMQRGAVFLIIALALTIFLFGEYKHLKNRAP